MMDSLRPIMDAWGLLFRALGPTECFGLKGFESKWVLRVVGSPLVFGALIALKHVYETHKNGAKAAWKMTKGYCFLAIYICCKSSRAHRLLWQKCL